MTANRDDFEHRLGQGLKRWAEAGEPTLDLEAYVRQQTGAAPPTGESETQLEPRPQPSSPFKARRPWLRWAASAAAAVLLLSGATFTFPAWAGTAAAWPLIGPVVQEIIMKDAGLKWAYDAGLIGEPLAEAKYGDVTVRVLAVVPDRALTTILYQITGLPKQPADPQAAKPIQAGRGRLLGSLARPAADHPWITVKQVAGVKGIFVSQQQPMQTPAGLVGTLTTNPVPAEGGSVELALTIEEQEVALSFPVSRSEAERLTREYPVNQTQTFGEITYTVDAVIQTPVQTVVKYHVTKPQFSGGYSWQNHEFSMRLEAGGEPIYSTGDYGFFAEGDFRYALFPSTKLPAQLVLPASVKGTPASTTWPLEVGTVQQVEGVPVTLTGWEATQGRLAISFQYPQQATLVAFGSFEGVDAEGKVIPLKEAGSSWSTGPRIAVYEFTFPEGPTPAAIRSTQVAVPVNGPWVFELK